MTRPDYYDSPEAPKANSLVPAVNVIVANDAGEILLIRRTDNGNWAVPGGAVDLGESFPDLGHFAPEKKPGKIADAVLRFFDAHAQPGTGDLPRPAPSARPGL